MYIGVDYYPEHWPQERWETDAAMMKEAGFNIVRLAEFAWTRMEPVEGAYDFAWLDKAIETLAKYEIKVILGTPTGSMPAWVAANYPETVAVDRNGARMPYGERKDNCPTNRTYRYLGQKITEAMALHYKDNLSVVGWQIDNEFGGPYCYCKGCKNDWHLWLEKKYKTARNLNEKWGTVFWSHEYRSFDEVPLPQKNYSNPSMQLDFYRFHTENVVTFQKEHMDIIRKHCPSHFITHNLMGFYDGLDYYELAKDLDFVSWDYYYNFHVYWPDRLREFCYGAAAHDLMRSLKRKNFWIMENSAGSLGWDTFGRNLRPGELKRMTFQNIAHGADGQIWFRWRTSRFGTEQYWHGLLQHDGMPSRRYREAAQTAKLCRLIDEKISGSVINAPVAFLLNYDDRWAFRFQPNGEGFDYTAHLMKYYTAFSRRGVNIDFVNYGTDFSQYKILVAPTAYIMTEQNAEALEQFVKNGGILITTFRTCVKDSCNAVHDMTLPGFLRGVCGIRVEEYEALGQNNAYSVSFTGKSFHAKTLVDWIIPESAEALAHYSEPDLEDYAAITMNQYGSGRCYYIGAEFEQYELYAIIADRALRDGSVKAVDELPEGVEITVREKNDSRFLFAINHSDDEVTLTLPQGTDILLNQKSGGSCKLAGRDVKIIEY